MSYSAGPDDWLRRAIEQGNAGAWRWNMRTNSVAWSDSLCAIMGRDALPADYEGFLAMLEPEDRQGIDAAIRKALSEAGQYIAEFRVTDGSGSVRWFEDRGGVICDAGGAPIEMVGLVYDVTARKAAQEAAEVARGGLEAKRTRRTELLRRQNAALGELSRSDVWQEGHGQEAFRHMAKVGADTLSVGRVGVWLYDSSRTRLVLEALYDRDTDAFSAGETLLLSDNPPYFEALERDRAIRADDALEDPRTKAFGPGYLRPLRIGAMLDAAIVSGGRGAGVVCFEHVGSTREWTEEEESFAASIADFAALSLALSERQLVEQKLLHAQKMESIGRLAGGVAHDFNNLLTAIIGGVDLAAMSEADGDATLPYLTEIREAATRAADLTSRLLAFARKQVVAPRVLDLNEVVTEASKVVERLIGEDIAFETALERPLWKVRIDPNQVHQILLNLAVNARDAMQGGGRLRIATACVEVDAAEAARHAGLHAGEYVRLSVSDTGTGIAEELKPHLFEPFFTTKELGKGTGLGLATCYGIVAQAGGQILAESQIGEGATFHVLLPRCRVERDPGGEQVVVVTDVRGDETVLIVEDDERVRRLACQALASYGYRVLMAGSGAEALALASDQSLDLALMVTDLVMPDMGGREVAALVRKHRPALPVLYVSGYAEQHATQIEPQEGRDFLTKPFTPQSLAARIREILDR